MEPTLPYAAYGSNLDHARMRHATRCPGAAPLGAVLLPGWRLVVNRYASIARDEAAAVPLGLWRILPRHLRALDRAEGTALGIYRRIRIRLPQPVAGFTEAWTYLEQVHRPGPPDAWYVAHLRQGYRDFGLDASALEDALSAGPR
ncbi:gamma-glutamylcyclotransferase family protein [Roseomonas sp. AR75]|uniref:gamma-glutamylcyclotransferase family protein n=1 Tax=Roseomonas sp. AR75 TaxID=2562311 RepID=UPI0010C093A9|nr:gamma-glutamylcyclotransferase family protein [Roseomonas sp. AR75]